MTAAESSVLLVALTYTPQHGLAIPLIFLSVRAVLRAERSALLINAVSIVLFVFYYMGCTLPVVPLFGPDVRKPDAIRILTYNVSLNPREVPAVAAAIKRQHADIICLQEAPLYGLPEAVTMLRKHFPDWHWRQQGEFVILSKYRIEVAKLHTLPNKYLSGFLEAIIVLPGDRKVRVANVHLRNPIAEAPLPGIIEATRRRMSMRASQLELLLQTTEKSLLPLIVTGDFNTPPRGAFYRRLRARWKDSFRGTQWGSGLTYQVGLALVRIDYIWTSDDITVYRSFVANETASDHYPLVADVSLFPSVAKR
jgi:vancomycin resistance protein VanJ